MSHVEIMSIPVENPENAYQVIIGQGNFSIYAIESILESLKAAVPGFKGGIAMNEAAPKLTRIEGTDEESKRLAGETCKKIGAGHVFVIFFKESFPINVLGSLKDHPCIACIYGATANPVEVIIGETEGKMRSVLGIADGAPSKAIENDEERQERRQLVRQIGYLS